MIAGANRYDGVKCIETCWRWWGYWDAAHVQFCNLNRQDDRCTFQLAQNCQNRNIDLFGDDCNAFTRERQNACLADASPHARCDTDGIIADYCGNTNVKINAFHEKCLTATYGDFTTERLNACKERFNVHGRCPLG